MRNGIVATIFLLMAAFAAHTQTVLRPGDLVAQARQAGKNFATVSLFEPAVDFRSVEDAVKTTPVKDYVLLEPDRETLAQLLYEAPATLSLQLPFEGRTLQVDLVKMESDPVRVRESHPTDFGQEWFSALHYRGVLQGASGSVAAFSFFEGEIMGLVSIPGQDNLVLGRLPQENAAPIHILYHDEPIISAQELGCATSDEGPEYLPTQLEAPFEFRNDNKCARIYLEVDNDIFVNKGGSAGALAYITGLFNQVATLYANENLSIVVSEVFLWTTNSPYSGSNPGTLLNQFQVVRTSFNGNLAMLLSYKPSGGIAVLSGFCHPLTIAKLSVAGIRQTYSAVPAYSWSVLVMAHELGHQFGSKHTHACAWNGNNTAIDGCAGFVEGSCALPPLPQQGTIMSYCHVTSVGINFSLGFGAQPGNVMRNAVAAAPCLTACTPAGGGGGGGNPTPTTCATNTVFFRLVLDDYGPETTWKVLNAAGQTLKSGGPYAKGIAGAVVLDTFCLPNGCYTLRVLDSYGDGLCCNFGQGSYSLRTATNQLLASGAEFGFDESTEFCVPVTVPNNVCVRVNFNSQPINSYGGAEDQGTHTLLSNGTVLRIQNNAWKAIPINYNVTPNTVIQFDFAVTAKGDIHGIGFDNDNVISADRTFKLYGTQNWGILNFNNYPGFSSWISYTIPVGQFYTGSFNRLFFVADHDVAPANANSFFKNIRIFEGNACNDLIPDDDAIYELPSDAPSVQIFPNPVRSELQLRIYGQMEDGASATLRIHNATGQLMEQRPLPAAASGAAVPVDVSNLQKGAYFLTVQSGAFVEQLKFIKQ